MKKNNQGSKVFLDIKKYDIWLIKLDPTVGSEQSGIRPCVIIQNNLFFKYQNTTLILPITGKVAKSGKYKILLEDYEKLGLDKESIILSFQIRTADKSRFIKKLGSIDDFSLRSKIKESLILTIDIDDDFLE